MLTKEHGGEGKRVKKVLEWWNIIVEKQYGLSEERGVLWSLPKILIKKSTEQNLNFLDAERTQTKRSGI